MRGVNRRVRGGRRGGGWNNTGSGCFSCRVFSRNLPTNGHASKHCCFIRHSLHALPVDPYDGAPLRYSRERGIVYSVGADFADTGGSSLPFEFTVSTDEADEETAEDDESEPTLALRFLPKFER